MKRISKVGRFPGMLPKFLAHTSTVCHVFDDPQGNDGDGGGDPPNPVEPADAGHDFNYRSHGSDSPELAEHVGSILDRGEQEPDARLSMSDIGALLKFDAPFKAPTPAAPVDPNAPKLDANGQPIPAPAPAAPAAPAQPAPADPNAALVAALKEAFPQGTPGQPAAPAQPAAPEAPKPFYGHFKPAMTVEPALVGALLGTDDPAQIAAASPAINALTNGIMNTVMSDMTALMMQQMSQVMAQIPQIATRSATAQSNEQRFYSKYKELDRPAFRQTVETIAGAYNAHLQKQGKAIVVDDQYLANLAESVHVYLERELGQSFRPKGAAPKAPTKTAAPGTPATPAPQKRRPFLTPGSSRPPAGNPGSPQSADSNDILGFVI